MKRIFIVGVSRSGTTLAQSMIGNHPDIITFPESHLLSATVSPYKFRRVFHKVSSYKKNKVVNFFKRMNKPSLYKEYTGSKYNLDNWVKYLITILDDLAGRENKEIWLEKTPRHLYFSDIIEKSFTNCYFIHIIREPISNIASLYSASLKYPHAFKQNTAEKAFRRYVKDISISNQSVKKDNHFVLYYDALVANPEEELKNLCKKLNINFHENMLSFSDSAKELQHSKEFWKLGNTKQIQKINKVQHRLNQSQIDWLNKKIAKLDYSILNYFK